jgi:hypothetical protein
MLGLLLLLAFIPDQALALGVARHLAFPANIEGLIGDGTVVVFPGQVA